MIFKKYRNKPLDLVALDIVMPRLANPDPGLLTQMKQDAARLQKGFNGEQKADYHLTQLDDDYDIFCDLTLRWRDRPFQIDTLVISPRAIFIISVKSLEGMITFQPHNQTLTQEVNGKVNRYECPIIQAERHKAMLMKWLASQQLGSMPIYYVVGISEISTSIHMEEESKRSLVQYVESIPNWIIQMDKQAHHRPNIPLQKKICSQLLHKAEDLYVDYLKKYRIAAKDLRLGVVCRDCQSLSVTYAAGKFICSRCGPISSAAALQSLYDLMHLWNLDSISNKQAMTLLQLDNRHQTLRLLRKSKLVKKPNTYKWILPKK